MCDCSGFISGIAYWGTALMVSDILHYLESGHTIGAAATMSHLPLMVTLALVALPLEEVRQFCPCGKRLVAPAVDGYHRMLTSWFPCFGRRLLVTFLSLYLGLCSSLRSLWLIPDVAFRGPLERWWEPLEFLWPVVTALLLTCAGLNILAVVLRYILCCGEACQRQLRIDTEAPAAVNKRMLASSSRAQDSPEAASVAEFMRSTGLDAYLEAFLNNGFDEMETLQEMEDSHLEECGMSAVHIVQFKKALKKTS